MRYLLCLLLLSSFLSAQTAELSELEREFQAAMTGVVLEGQSTRDGKPGVFEDKYTVEKIEK